LLPRSLEQAYHAAKRMKPGTHEEVDMLWAVFVVLLILWLLGFSLHIGGGLIHLLLVVGLVVLVINLLSGRRTAN
jgi:Flp pilus assembly protein TadB